MRACINAYVNATIFTKRYSMNVMIFSKRYRQIYVHQGRIEPPQCVVYSPHALALGNNSIIFCPILAKLLCRVLHNSRYTYI